MRLAYADPPYPSKAHLYPEKTEVDHAALIAQLCEYDGWALSTDERSLAYVLSLCPPKTRVLAWCRANAAPLLPHPYAAWEPVLCQPARTRNCELTRSFLIDRTVNTSNEHPGFVGRKTKSFCEWVVTCLGAEHGDVLDDLYPGVGTMGETFSALLAQPRLFSLTARKLRRLDVEQLAARQQEPLFATPPRKGKFQRHSPGNAAQ